MVKKDKKVKILVLGSGIYARPFKELGDIILVSGKTQPEAYNWGEVKLVVFTGGADVDPSMYNEKIHKSTHSDIHRDNMEKKYYHQALRSGVKMVGICRGSQFLTVMNGGSLIQHVYSHAIQGTHSITTNDGEQVEVTSTHHQMMYPKGRFKLLAWASGLSKQYETGVTTAYTKKGNKTDEPEAVWYGNTNTLAVQFHPEYMNEDTGGYKYFQKLLKEYIM